MMQRLQCQEVESLLAMELAVSVTHENAVTKAVVGLTDPMPGISTTQECLAAFSTSSTYFIVLFLDIIPKSLCLSIF